MNRKNKMLLWCVALFGAIALVGCSDSDDATTSGGGGQEPVAGALSLNSFYPNYGKYLEKVIFTGSGFASAENVKVYFNQRPAAVIGVNAAGTEMYALAPRLPGDDCIISVVQGTDSLTYEQHFAYTTSTTVTTICGNGTKTYTGGTLADSQVSPYYCCVDANDNLFIINRNGDTGTYSVISRADFVTDEMSALATGVIGNVPACDPITQKIVIPTEQKQEHFIELNPLEMWAPRHRYFKWNCGNYPPQPWKHCMVVNPSDGKIYTRYYHGQFVRVDPVSYEVEFLLQTGQFDTYGMCFRKSEPNVLYFTNWQNHRLYKFDMNQPREEWTYVQVNGGTGTAGHRDGDLGDALFNNPSMIFCDEEDNMYLADCSNHCIRRITPENQVETVLGVPGTAGWKDGTKEEALFRNPRGLGISQDGSVYVCDYGNARIRKLSIN